MNRVKVIKRKRLPTNENLVSTETETELANGDPNSSNRIKKNIPDNQTTTNVIHLAGKLFFSIFIFFKKLN